LRPPGVRLGLFSVTFLPLYSAIRLQVSYQLVSYLWYNRVA